MFDAVFYQTDAGNEPVLEWLRSLDADERRIIGEDLRTVQFGFPLGMPLCRPLGDGLFEVRSSFSKKEARLIFFQTGKTLVIVGGFIKKTQKTPNSEIDTAKSRKTNYETKIKQRKPKK